MHDAEHVDVHDLLPALGTGEACGVRVCHEAVGGVDAGGVDKHVRWSGLEDLFHPSSHAGGVGHIANHGNDVGGQIGGFLQRLKGASEDKCLGSGFRKTLGCSLSHATTTAGDDDDLICPTFFHVGGP